MATYKVDISPFARKQLDKIHTKFVRIILTEVSKLATNPRPVGCIKLKGSNYYRIRVADYRVIYSIEDKVLTVEVVAIGHRSNIYD